MQSRRMGARTHAVPVTYRIVFVCGVGQQAVSSRLVGGLEVTGVSRWVNAMLFMLRIDFRDKQGDALLAYFDEHGLTRYKAGVEIRGAWASREQQIVYVIADAADAAQLEAAMRDLSEFGRVEYHPVVDALQL